VATHIAAAVVQRPDGKVLLLKRAPGRTTNPNQWCFVTGYVEEGEEPAATAARELHEELGVDAQPTRAGRVVVVQTGKRDLRIHPYLFQVADFGVRLEREHVAYAWIDPPEVTGYDTVPQLDDDLRALDLL
jgi:8-oxo-dGTP pyrophosphatase MutT (NUDIX family)